MPRKRWNDDIALWQHKTSSNSSDGDRDREYEAVVATQVRFAGHAGSG